MKNAHRVFGLAFVAVFLGTGAYMLLRFPAVFREDMGCA